MKLKLNSASQKISRTSSYFHIIYECFSFDDSEQLLITSLAFETTSNLSDIFNFAHIMNYQ